MTRTPFRDTPQSDYRLLGSEKIRGKKFLAIRTDKPEAEIYLLEDNKKLDEIRWQAHRELSDTLHLKIKEILDQSSIEPKDLGGIVVFRGPGSFTGLRIGLTVANTLAYALQIPIAGSLGSDWLDSGVKDLLNGKDYKIVTPEYGAEPRITKPRK